MQLRATGARNSEMLGHKLNGPLLVVVMLLLASCTGEPVAAPHGANSDPSSNLGDEISVAGETQYLLPQVYPKRPIDWPRWLKMPEHTYGQGELVTKIVRRANPNYHSVGFTMAAPEDLGEYFLSLFPDDFELRKTTTKQNNQGNKNSMYIMERSADRYRIIIDIEHGEAFGGFTGYSEACFKHASVNLDLIN